MMKKYLVIAGFLSIVFLLQSCKNTPYSMIPETTTPVWVEDVAERTIEEFITATGTAKASKTVELKSEIEGQYVLQKNPKTGKPYKLGDVVEKGAIIVKLVNQSYENDIQLESKKLQVDVAEREWEGQKSLLEKGGATPKQVNDAQVAYINSRLTLENAQINLEKMSIVSPFKGVIVNLPYFTPDVNVASGEIVAGLMDYSSMYMETQFPENAITKLSVGQRVYITNYNIKSDTLKGVLTQLSPAINEDTRTFAGFITIENPELKLRPGMFAKADIVTLRKENVLSVPKTIVLSRRGNKILFTVSNSVAIEKSVKTGISNDRYIEIEEGLESDDKVVVRGYEWLRNQSSIKVMR